MPAAKPANLIDRTFDESVALTQEVRNYIAYHEGADRREFELTHCLHVGYHHTRVSARLIQVMTWLLAMKALLSGEISPEQFTAPQYALTDSEECSSDKGEEDANIPAGLRDLLQRSHALYSRIKRLDAMVHAKLEAGEVPNFAMLSGPGVVSIN
ncbi:MAG: DUF1465 family protein [Alphaproteobacteria bacterium]|nr:DUF1465 family protein [Alphaproteobacteria bacterium]